MQIDTIKDFLKGRGWQITQVEDKNIILFGIQGKNGNFQCVVDLIEADHRLIFFSVYGANTPPEKRQKMLQLLNAFNYKLFFGNFEMDPDDGGVRFRMSISYRHIELSQKIVEEVVMTSIIIMDGSLPSIEGIMFGNLDFEKALELSETNDTE